MKKLIGVFIIILLFAEAAKANPNDLSRLTVVNESPFPLEISLTGEFTESTYFLKVPKGDADFPVEKSFTISRDVYQMSIYYVELWDPVYGKRCGGAGGELNAMHNNRITVKDCHAAYGGRHKRTPEPTATPEPRPIDLHQTVPSETSILTACQGVAWRSFTRSITCS